MQILSPAEIETAAQIIRAGGVVAFPTETVYGLGANALDAKAVERIFAAKNRPHNDPIIVHIAALDQLQAVAAVVPDLANQLATQFWPGALTLILKRSNKVPSLVTAKLPNLAVRMPSHPIAQALIRAAGVPIAAPSANLFTRPSPTTAAHVMEDLADRIDAVIDGGATTIGLESTILDLTQSPPMILRPGGVLLEDLRRVIPDVQIRERALAMDEIAPAPGMLEKHYAPRATLFVFAGDDAIDAMQRTVEKNRQKKVGLLLMNDEREHFTHQPYIFLLGDDLQAAALNLFAGLRALDQRGVDLILMRAPQRTGIGIALWDRLQRAGTIIT